MKMQKNMKVAMSFFMVLFLLMLSAGVSLAAEASLYDSGSGTTTAPSGTSVFAVSSSTYTVDANNTVINLNKLRPYTVLDISLASVTLPSGVTFGQAASTDDGTVEGDTYQIYARVGNDKDDIASAERFLLNNTTKFSSAASPFIIHWQPPPGSYARLEYVSGVSPIYDATINIIPLNDASTPDMPVITDSPINVNENSGVSQISVPEGARRCKLTYNGDGEAEFTYPGDGTMTEGDGTQLGAGKSPGEIFLVRYGQKIDVIGNDASGCTVVPVFYTR